ncbi:glycosyltransferase [Tepidiphilus sp. HLB4]
MRHPIIGLTLHYRHAALTDRCVRSLLADGADAVLVWDNTGDGGESAKGITVCQEQPDRVVLEISPANLGFAAGVNRGIEAILARWPQAWVFLLNNDAEVLPGAVSTLSEALAAHSSAVVAFPLIDQGDRFSGATYYQRHFGLLSSRPLPASVMHPSGCALMIAPERIGLPLFDEDFFMYGEDVMLGARLGPQRMVHVPEVLVRHAGNAGSGQGSAFYEERMVTAHWLLARKLAKNRLELGLYLLGRALSLSARALLRALRQRSLIPLTALWRGWRLASRGLP